MTAVRRLSLVDTDASTVATPPPGSVRVAIASTDLKGLNAHFGSAPKFAVYDVTPSGWSFVEAVEFEGNTEGDGTHRTDGDDRITPKVDALTDKMLDRSHEAVFELEGAAESGNHILIDTEFADVLAGSGELVSE